MSQALLHKDYINKLADYLFTHDDLTEAGILYDKSIELYNRKNAELWQKAGFIYQKIGSYKKAIDYYLQSDLLIPDKTHGITAIWHNVIEKKETTNKLWNIIIRWNKYSLTI